MKAGRIGAELFTWLKQVFHLKNGWILLPGVIAVLLVYAADRFDICPWILDKPFHENLALLLVSMILIVLTAKSFVGRDPLMIYLAALSLAFLVREFHDTKLHVFGDYREIETKTPAYLLLLGIGLWGLAWHERLFARLNRSVLLKVAIFGMLWGYLFSQLIARRVFRGILPDEELLHVPMEETAETVAHLFFLVLALCCFFLVPNRAKEVSSRSTAE